MMNIYNGNVLTDDAALAVVELPEWFEALNRDFRCQLTVVDDGPHFAHAKVASGVSDNRFTIRTSMPRTMVSWQITGIRHDRWANENRIPVEQFKRPEERRRFCIRSCTVDRGPLR
jgi:trimeric autotransporter adhesin